MDKRKLKTVLGRDLKVGDVISRGAFGTLRVVELQKPKPGRDYFLACFKTFSGAPLLMHIDMNEEIILVLDEVRVW